MMVCRYPQAQDECKELSERAAGLGREDGKMEVDMEMWDYSRLSDFPPREEQEGGIFMTRCAPAWTQRRPADTPIATLRERPAEPEEVQSASEEGEILPGVIADGVRLTTSVMPATTHACVSTG